ncbi:MAG: hypothetical protein D4R88_07745 [Methanosarcinales archaeon]|nr:MAG: hypothetical protein D4R88_07745 [Methanosarcinales archaeon]
MNRRIKFTVLAIVILLVTSVYLISQQEIEPPPATLKIEGTEQISGIGSFCWKGTWKALCVDMIGIPTALEPLLASSSFTAHLRLPIQEPPYDLRLNAVRVKDEDELNFSARGWHWWKEREEKLFTLHLEREQDIELSLEPGLYVLSIGAWWKDKGSASYGFLVEVRANGSGAVPTTPVSPTNQTLASNVPKTTIMSIQSDFGTIGTKVVITGAGFTARDNNVAFRLRPEDSPESFKVGYINNLVSRDGRTIEFVIPELLGACAFPLPETTPVTVCPDIGLNFKAGIQTYPVFVVNQNGTSNSVNFTVSR